VRAAVTAAIDAALYERARPGITGDVFVLSRSCISEAIIQVTGEDRHKLNWPLSDLPYTGGKYSVIGTVSFVNELAQFLATHGHQQLCRADRVGRRRVC